MKNNSKEFTYITQTIGQGKVHKTGKEIIMTKMTYRKALEYILEHTEMPSEVEDSLTKLYDSLGSKTRKNPNAEKNAVLYDLLLSALTHEGDSVTGIMGKVELPLGTSNQSCTSVLGSLVRDGKAVNYKEKGRSLYRLAD